MKQDGYTVYMHKNKINNKVYIGITSQIPEQRWRNGKNYYANEHFNRAIHKYGWKEFEHIILYSDLSKTDAESLEIELINKYDSTNKEKGYNIELGGNSTGKHSEETIRKISESQLGEKNHMYGKTGYKNSRSRQVICLNNKNIFGSAYEAGRSVGIKSVDSCCRGEKKSAGVNQEGEKLVWMWYDEYLKLSDKEIEILINKSKEKKKINKDSSYSNNNNSKQIKCITKNIMFNCIKEACEYFNISASTLSQHLKGVTKQCKSKVLNEYLQFKYV